MRILLVSPRVAPGLLTREAWTVLENAASIYVTSKDQYVGLSASGLVVELDEGPIFDEPGAVWVTNDPEWAKTSAEQLRDRDIDVFLIPGSFDIPGARVLDLVRVMQQLRNECPWTMQQTHESLSHYLLEETHEALEALDGAHSEHLKEELGDLLMQIVFHAVIAAESEGWSLDDVAQAITTKLMYRNPHVFSDLRVSSADEVDANWQRLKSLEKQRDSSWDGIPLTLPALATAAKILRRMEITELDSDELGERFLALVLEANAAGVDPESLVRQTLRRLVD